MTYEALLKYGLKKAETKGKEPEAVKFLLLETFEGDASQFYLSQKIEADAKIEALFLDRLNQYVDQAIPVQHLLGYSYFFGHKLAVSDAVLIPRVETEQLVEQVLFYYDTYFSNQSIKVLDLGCGSGCIGLTLKKEEPKMEVLLSDISFSALEVTKQNANQLNVDVTIIESDLFDQIQVTFDMIISNPPYIPDHVDVMDIVKIEPSVALYGGALGLDFYERILKTATHYIKPYGLIGFEHGYPQQKAIYELAHQYFPNAKIYQMKDLQGKDRFTFIGLGGVLK